jgi:hypothetical protein
LDEVRGVGQLCRCVEQQVCDASTGGRPLLEGQVVDEVLHLAADAPRFVAGVLDVY